MPSRRCEKNKFAAGLLFLLMSSPTMSAERFLLRPVFPRCNFLLGCSLTITRSSERVFLSMITGVRLPWFSYKNNLGSIGTDHIGPKFAIFRIMIGRYDVFMYLKAASIDDYGISEQDGFCNERTKGCCEPDFRRKRLYNISR
jgi:hypothetical protein